MVPCSLGSGAWHCSSAEQQAGALFIEAGPGIMLEVHCADPLCSALVLGSRAVNDAGWDSWCLLFHGQVACYHHHQSALIKNLYPHFH